MTKNFASPKEKTHHKFYAKLIKERTTRVVWSEEAFNDLDDIHAFIAINSAKAANTIIASILSRTRQLESFPQSGSIIEVLQHTTKEYRIWLRGTIRSFIVMHQNLFL